MPRSNTIEDFHNRYKINPRTDCWEWQGVRDGRGYGRWMWQRKQMLAHRFSAQYHIGSIQGKVVCHKCDNPCCVNPSHLFIGTQQDNMRDRNVRGRTARGTQANKSNLTEQDVLNIRADTTSSHISLARKYNVTYHSIRHIRTRQSWKHI